MIPVEWVDIGRPSERFAASLLNRSQNPLHSILAAALAAFVSRTPAPSQPQTAPSRPATVAPRAVQPTESVAAAPSSDAQSLRDAADAARRAAEAAEKSAAAAERSARAVEEMALRASAVAAPVVPVPPPPPVVSPATGLATGSKWDGTLGLSLIALTGNSETLTFSATAAFDRRFDPWTVSTRFIAAYGQSRVATEAEPSIVALLASALVRGDRKLTSIASAFVQVGSDTDHVKSVEYRAFAEGGAAIVWVEQKEGDDVKLLVRTDLGLRYSQESRFQYFPTPVNVDDVTLVAPKLGLGFRYSLNPNVTVFEEAEILTNVAGPSRVIALSTTRLSAKLTAGFAISSGLQLSFDSAPAPGKRRLDSVLSVGADFTF